MSAQPNQRFTFVSFTSPHETKKLDTQKRIRSAAAFSGWDKRLNRPPAAEDDLENGYGESCRSESSSSSEAVPTISTVSASRPGREVKTSQPTNQTLPPSDPAREYGMYGSTSYQRKSPTELESTTTRIPMIPEEDVRTLHQQADACSDCLRLSREDCRSCRRHSSTQNMSFRNESRVSKPSKARRTAPPQAQLDRIAPLLEDAGPERIGTGRLDPFRSYPVPAEPWYDWVLHHMLTVFAPRGWPSLGITTAQGKDWERFMTQHALQEPALFYVRLLFATGDLISLRLLRPEVSLWLRTQAVKAINNALNDSSRATSDALILAVGRIALHESMYGDRIAANAIHRPAQYRMITMRGGMNALPFPELVKRLMRWADRVMSMQGGTPRFLAEDESQNYTVDQSVTVLEKWVPHEGMALRQKVQQKHDPARQ